MSNTAPILDAIIYATADSAQSALSQAAATAKKRLEIPGPASPDTYSSDGKEIVLFPESFDPVDDEIKEEFQLVTIDWDDELSLFSISILADRIVYTEAAKEDSLDTNQRSISLNEFAGVDGSFALDIFRSSIGYGI